MPRFDHIVLVMFENHAYSQITGVQRAVLQLAWPARARSSPSRTRSPTRASPTISRCSPARRRASPTTTARKTFTGTNLGAPAARRRPDVQGLLRVDAVERLHRLLQRHVRAQAQQLGRLQQRAGGSNLTYASFPTSANYATLPTVSFVTPNMCNDMHDCSIGTGDTWLQEQPRRVRAVGQDPQQPADRHLRRGQLPRSTTSTPSSSART